MISDDNQTKVLFVCLGNICRSPTAHGVFEAMVQKNKLQHRFKIDSAATGDWQIGKSPDSRALAAAKRRGYDFGHLRARQIQPEDFFAHDYIFAMDKQNLADLQQLQPADFQGELTLFLHKAFGKPEEVPDPYYGQADGFETVLNLLESACEKLLQQLQLEKQAKS